MASLENIQLIAARSVTTTRSKSDLWASDIEWPVNHQEMNWEEEQCIGSELKKIDS